MRHTPESVRAACERERIHIEHLTREVPPDIDQVWWFIGGGRGIAEFPDGALMFAGRDISRHLPDPPAAFHGSIPHDTNGDVK